MKIRKRLLVALLSTCMLVCCLPTAAFAGDDEAVNGENTGSSTYAQQTGQDTADSDSEELAAAEADAENPAEGSVSNENEDNRLKTAGDAVCRIGAQEYASISEAVEAAPEGAETTITMIADVTLDSTVVIPEGKKIVLTDDGTKRSLAAGSNTIFDVGGELTLNGTSNDNLVLNGGDDCKKSSIADVSGTMNIKSGTINGGTIKEPEKNISGAITVVNGTLNMSGGIVQNTKVEDNRYNAPLRIYTGGKMNMTGGEIRNNEGTAGAGIAALTNITTDALPTADAPVVNISGGKIYNNNGMYGSAVLAAYNAIVNISGGEISDNEGGQGSLYFARSILNMTGGVVKDNKAHRGGGIYAVRESKINITGGSIINNTAEDWGGAIFLIDSKPEVYLENALITGNEATKMGGGLWCCPTGTARIQANEGVAIFDNKAGGAGDDITNLYTDKQEFKIELSGRMLGAGKVDYYKDGEIYMLPRDDSQYWHGGINADAPRYGEIYEKVNPENIGEVCLSLKAVATDAAKASAKAQANVIIQGNKAGYGGAIACNAAIFAGTPSGTSGSDEWTLKVRKVWDNVPENKQVEVTVALIVNGKEVDTVALNAGNGWENTFNGLPDPDTVEGGYKIVEKTKGFKAVYSDVVTDKDNPTVMEVTVTNSLEPTGGDKEDKKGGSPATGDELMAALAIVLMLVGGTAFVINRRKPFNK